MQACPRCGTFAELTSNGFRELCPACWPAAQHRLDVGGAGPGALLWTAAVLLVDVVWPLLLVALVEVTVQVALVAAGLRALRIAEVLVVGSVLRPLLMGIAVERTLGGNQSWKAALARVRPTFGRAIATALAVTLLTALAAAMVPCLSIVPGALFVCAVPVALFEGQHPFDAMGTSARRVGKCLFSVAFFVLLVNVGAKLPYLIAARVMDVTSVRQLPDDLPLSIMATLVALDAVMAVPQALTQVVVWRATQRAAQPPVLVV